MNEDAFQPVSAESGLDRYLGSLLERVCTAIESQATSPGLGCDGSQNIGVLRIHDIRNLQVDAILVAEGTIGTRRIPNALVFGFQRLLSRLLELLNLLIAVFYVIPAVCDVLPGRIKQAERVIPNVAGHVPLLVIEQLLRYDANRVRAGKPALRTG